MTATEYYYLDADHQRIGPLSFDQLKEQSITPETLIWKAGLSEWTSATNVPEVAAFLSSTPPPIPPQIPPCPPPLDESKSSCSTDYSCAGNPSFQNCPPTYLVWSVLATIFCCMPFGIVAICRSAEVEKFYYRKEYAKAKKASDSARNWCWVCLLSNLIVWGLYGFFLLVILLCA